jgi:ribonuclease HI
MTATNASSAETWSLTFDGGSIGNPGPSAGAAVLVRPDGAERRASLFLAHATNNQAEYAGLLCGLRLARELGVERLRVRGDSKLVVCQFTGEWRAKDASMQASLAAAKDLGKFFVALEIGWIPREENAEADLEVRRCLDAHVPQSVLAQASFQELAKRKVGGQDKFTRMKREALLEFLGDDADAALAAIATALADIPNDRDKLALTALRWAARGLPPVQAVQKVLVDLQISRQAAKRRR